MRENLKQIYKNPLLSGSLIMIIGSNGTNFLNYAYHLVMGRMLGPLHYGELATLISLLGIILVIPSSFSLVIIKLISSSQNSSEEGKLISWFSKRVLILSLILFLAVVALGPIISKFLKIENIFYILLLAVSLFFSLQALLNRSVLQGLVKFNSTVLSLMVENGSKVILAGLFVYLGFSVFGALGAIVVASIIGFLVSKFSIRGHLTSHESTPHNTQSILRLALPISIQAIAATSLYTADVILVKHFFSGYQAGIYAALSGLGKIIFFGAGPVSAVMFPLVSKRHSRGEPFKKLFLFSFILTLLLSGTILLVYYLFPDLSISLLYGKLYLEGDNLLFRFGVFVALLTLSNLFINFYLSRGINSVIVLPAVAAIGQILGIWFFHDNLKTVISVSVYVSVLLFVSLCLYFVVIEKVFPRRLRLFRK